MSGCTSRQRRRYRFAPSAFSPRKPTPRRLRWTRRRTRLIPAGRKVFMRLKPSPNIVSSAPSSSPSADSRKNDSIPDRRAGPAKTSTPPCGLGRAPPDGTGVSSRRKAGSRGTHPAPLQRAGSGQAVRAIRGTISLQTDPRATSRQHCPHTTPFLSPYPSPSPRPIDRSALANIAVRKQYGNIQNCPFSRQKKKCGFFLFK